MLGRREMTPADLVRPAARAPTPPRELSIAAMRAAMEPFCRKRNAYAFLLLALDIAMFAAGQWLTITATRVWLVALGVLLTWSAIVRLFIIGHDACHQALTSSRRLNDAIGRLAFLVSLTPYSLWRAGHNIVHHGFNNLRGRDFIWEPKQAQEYLLLPRWRRALERVYRGPLGPPLYYFVEIWWKRLFFPNRRNMPAARSEFTGDSLLAAAAAAAWIGAIFWYTRTHDRSFWVALSLAWLLPFVLWNWTVGLVVYLHHTHPKVPWFNQRREWQQHAAQVSATAHVLVPAPLGAWIHYIMEHPAHHLNATIPLYNLKAAQRHLYEIGAKFERIPLTLAYYRRCLRTCKLYDYATGAWIPFPST